MILALADRGDAAALPAVLQVAKSGPEPARSVAIRVLRRLGNAACVPVLLDAALDADEDVSQTAMTVLADMPGADVDNDLAARLLQAEGKLRLILIELAGRRPIAAAVPTLLKAAGDSRRPGPRRGPHGLGGHDRISRSSPAHRAGGQFRRMPTTTPRPPRRWGPHASGCRIARPAPRNWWRRCPRRPCR